MKKLFVIFAIAMMFAATSCTCSRQTENDVNEVVVEAVDSTVTDVLDAVDSTLTVTTE